MDKQYIDETCWGYRIFCRASGMTDIQFDAIIRELIKKGYDEIEASSVIYTNVVFETIDDLYEQTLDMKSCERCARL